jgi:hypothetical protein
LTNSYAKLMNAESQLPAALAGAFRKGQLHGISPPLLWNTPNNQGSPKVICTFREPFPRIHARQSTNVDTWETEGGACLVPPGPL